ncbi:uncharacterized protein [Primulina eburnea]|uniref:uncharacterized protein n=1 Tax=Primulina eburnea TaxID=1245227 RepID=UPI003C6C755E
MNDKEILTNVIGLGILVITINANVWMQLIALESYENRQSRTVLLAATIFLLVSFLALVFSAIMVPTTKRFVESKYQEMHKVALRGEISVRAGETHDEHRGRVKKYWVMVETGSPQFVAAHSVVSIASSAICFPAAIILVEMTFWDFSLKAIRGNYRDSTISYGDSVRLIYIFQLSGMCVGTLSAAVKWFFFLHTKCSKNTDRSFIKKLEIEAFWIQRLVDWRGSLSSLHIRHYWCGKCLLAAKVGILDFCIGVQTSVYTFMVLKTHKKIKTRHPSHATSSNDHMESESGHGAEQDIQRFVILLDRKEKLSEVTLKRICNRADKIIQTGTRKKPKNLKELLKKSVNFRGVGKFDQFQNLHSQEPPSCWTLAVVTLTSIAIGLPHIENHKTDQLLRSVREGMALAKLVEKTLKTNEFVNIRNAADVTWVGVILYRKWQDMNLQRKSCEYKNNKEILNELSNKAERILSVFNAQVNEFDLENSLNWPVAVVAAHSMYRISHTILLSFEEENEQPDEELFEQLSSMIADVLAACLTNLPRAITAKYHRNAIEKREKSMHKALLLLGQTEDIVEFLQQFERPSLDPEKAVYIDEWRNLLIPRHGEHSAPSVSTSRNETGTTPAAN